MATMIRISALVLLLICAAPAGAQGPVPDRSEWTGAGYLEAGGPAFLLSASDENRYGPLWLRLGAGLVYDPVDEGVQPFILSRGPREQRAGLALISSAGFLFGGPIHNLEAAVGFTSHVNRRDSPNLWTTTTLGYRFVRLSDGRLIRAGLTGMRPFDGPGSVLAWYLAIGQLQW